MIKIQVSKFIFFLTLTLTVFFVPEVTGQQPVSSPTKLDLIVINKKWHITRGSLTSAAVTTNPEDYQREVLQNMRDNIIRAERGIPPERVANPPQRRLISAIKRNYYTYELEVRNTSDKKIKEITWEYIFFDPVTRLELGRKRFVSKVKIPLGKEKKLIGKSVSPPTNIVGATSVGDTPPNQYLEQILIRRIEYTNGSVMSF